MRWWLSCIGVLVILICVVRGDELSYFHMTKVLKLKWIAAGQQLTAKILNEIDTNCGNGGSCADYWRWSCILFFAGDHAGNAHFVNTKAGCLQ